MWTGTFWTTGIPGIYGEMVPLIDFAVYSFRVPLETLAPRDLVDPVDLL